MDLLPSSWLDSELLTGFMTSVASVPKVQGSMTEPRGNVFPLLLCRLLPDGSQLSLLLLNGKLYTLAPTASVNDTVFIAFPQTTG